MNHRYKDEPDYSNRNYLYDVLSIALQVLTVSEILNVVSDVIKDKEEFKHE